MNKPRVRTVSFFVIFLFSLLVYPWLGLASERAHVQFSETYLDEGATMELRGIGVKHAFFLKAFVAAFYTEPAPKEIIIGEVYKHLEVEYSVNIPKKKLMAFTLRHIKRNVSRPQLEKISREIDLMEKYFENLKKGDRFSLTYIPGIGSKFAHNGKLTGIIEGEDFAKAIFSVWIGEHPFDRRLKHELLGKLDAPNIKKRGRFWLIPN